MARKKKHPEHVNHERWLISYADFITLLFAFFVVMFAVSQVDSAKLGRFTESFSKAVGIEMFPETGQGLLPGGERPMPGPENGGIPSAVISEVSELRAQLVAMGRRQELPKGLGLVQRRNELVIRLSEKLLFDAGDDALNGPATRVVQVLAKVLKARNVDVRVEGHTDDRPIHTSRFRSNWELSTGRATAVVAVLAKEGLEPVRLSAAGYGEFHPLATNSTDDGRRQNRRVDLVIAMSDLAARAEMLARAEADGGAPPDGGTSDGVMVDIGGTGPGVADAGAGAAAAADAGANDAGRDAAAAHPHAAHAAHGDEK
jgi:chemotaxis protein MotB